MIKRLFKNDDTLMVSVNKHSNGNMYVLINADSTLSERKSRLYLRGGMEDRIKKDLEVLWKGIKTTKKQSVALWFAGIDWYEDTDDSYVLPVISVRKGQRVAKVDWNEHTYIPKEWSVSVMFVMKPTTKVTPILEAAYKTLDISKTDPLGVRIAKALKNFNDKERIAFYNGE